MDAGCDEFVVDHRPPSLQAKVVAPRNIRETLLLFTGFDSDSGIAQVLDTTDFGNMSRRQVYYATTGRCPLSLSDLSVGSDYDPKQDFERAIRSEEFQRDIRERVIMAFPEKRRSIFIHVPKCAGSDLTAAMRDRFPVLHLSISNVRGCSQADFFTALRSFVLAAARSDTIGFGGHVSLKWYLLGNHIRFEDDVFTIVRDPRQMIYSQVSYVLTQIVRANHKTRAKTRAWIKDLGLGGIPDEPSQSYLEGLGRQMLRNSKAVRSNNTCQSLGRGTAESAIEYAILSDIEITDTTRYSAWRAQKFGVKHPQQINKSLPLFRPDMATPDDQDFVASLVTEDIKLYDKILAKLNATERLSIGGSTLA